MGEGQTIASGPAVQDDRLLGILRDPGEPERARQEALEKLFDRHHARVFRQCERLLGDAERAEDMVQEIFLELYQGDYRYDPSQRFTAWLYVLVRNRCLNRLRRSKREVATEDPARLMDQLQAAEAGPGRDADLAHDVGELCRRELNPREQAVVHLRFVWRMSIREIDQLLGLENRSGARTHLTTAMRKLRRAAPARFGLSTLDALLGEE